MNSVIINGVKFSSMSSACRKFRVSRSTFRDRINKGMSVKKALGISKQETNPDTNSNKLPIIIDGVTYHSKISLCKAFKINPGSLYNRINRGMSIIEALKVPKSNAGTKGQIVTVDDVEYPSKTAACNAFGVTINTLYYRINRGMSFEDALKKSSKKNQQKNNIKKNIFVTLSIADKKRIQKQITKRLSKLYDNMERVNYQMNQLANKKALLEKEKKKLVSELMDAI